MIVAKNDSEVEELLSHLHDAHNSTKTWRQALLRHTSGKEFASLAKFVAADRKSHTVFPPLCDVFSALNSTPLQNVKIVIVGQDPYHGPDQAHGLSFSVRKGVNVPASLKNIYKELKNDPNADFPAGGNMPNHGYLERWAKQGVLMLNAVLTVRKGLPNSHGKRGWESFSDEIIRILDRESEASNKGLVFLLWGRPASAKAQAILHRGGRSKHKIICTSHPSPLGATKTNAPFLGSKCFSRANEALKELGMEPIDWNVDGDHK
jgi:uracil-DNA glycosylase